MKKYFPYDVRKAKELLAAANWDSTREIEFKYPSGEKAALLCSVIQQQFAAVGIKTKLGPEDAIAVYPQTSQTRNFQLTATATATAMSDPDIYLRSHTTAGAGNGNSARWSDAEVDAFIPKQQNEFDPEKQKALIMDAQRLIPGKFSPVIYLYCSYRLYARWAYFHYIGSWLMENVGVHGQHWWIDTDHPVYPKDRRWAVIALSTGTKDRPSASPARRLVVTHGPSWLPVGDAR